MPCTHEFEDSLCGTHEFMSISRAVARSENLGGLVILGGENVPPLVEIGLTDLPKTVGA